MGEASRRGTRDERIALAQARREADRVCAERAIACAVRQASAAREARIQALLAQGREIEARVVNERRSKSHLPSALMVLGMGLALNPPPRTRR